MSSRRNSLSLPERTGTQDPGAHELESSDSDEHFSDAISSPVPPFSPSPPPFSPTPRTRVEKVDDEPSYGEVPGTEAYRMRQGDAEPDEIAIIPGPHSAPRSRGNSEAAPSEEPVPKTVVEETPDEEGSVTHADVKRKRRADPPPDLVLRPDEVKADKGSSDLPITPISKSQKTPRTPRTPKTPASARSRKKPSVALRSNPMSSEADDDFGDDFDDFEEGGEEGDFDDFEDGFEPPEEPIPAAVQAPTASLPPARPLPFPVPDFDSMDLSEIMSTAEPYLNVLFPIHESDFPPLPPLGKDSGSTSNNSIFLTPRSASLWAQLVAPPPLQPPDWIRSRIRRLFLVSLGVPVDLDEILPASKQKKLVLPSLRRVSSTGSLHSNDSRPMSRSVSRRPAAGASRNSFDSVSGKPSGGPGGSGRGRASAGGGAGAASDAAGGGHGRRKGPAQPAFDLVAAKQLCTTTDAALDGMTDQELKLHVEKLKVMQAEANELLEFWTKRTDEKIGDREAFEGVIENLVKHARKVRK